MVVLTPTKMGRAAEMSKRGLSYDKIAEELRAGAETVRRRLQLAAVRGDLSHRYPPRGPPMDPRTERHIFTDILRHPRVSFGEIGKSHGRSASTVSRVAAAHFIHRFVMKRKPLLTPENRRKRLLWASKTSEQDWTSVIVTDEALVRIGDQGRH